MKAAKLALLVLLSSAGCGADRTDYYFTGRVYDGAAGTRLTDYRVELQFLDRRIEGLVEEDGSYFIGPLTPFNDYTVAIFADGYRSFLSHNVMKVDDEITFNNTLTDDEDRPDRSQYFDAYLYPLDVVASEVSFRISLSDAATAPSGTIRLRPAGGSALLSMPAGVAGQVWANDDDLQFATVTKPFANGLVIFTAGELVYGVTYLVSIYGVDGHAQLDSVYTAGADGSAAFVLGPQSDTPLSLAFVSTQLGTPVASGEVVFIFNQPIELDALASADTYLRSLEANFSIDSPDLNGDTQVNALEPFDPLLPAGSLGLAATISGSKLTLTWSPTAALLTTDAADPIRAVTYGGLDGFVLRPVGGAAADSATLGGLFGSNAITVPVTP